MAKAKDLAALAGLAGLAYAMRNKDKPEQENKGRQSDGAGYKSTETREEPRRKIEDYQKKAPLDGTEMYPSGVMGGASQPVSKPAPAVKPDLGLQSFTTRKDPRESETGMSRGTRTMPPSASTTSSSEEGMKNYKSRRSLTPATPSTAESTVSSSAEGMKNYVPRKPIYRQETQRERAESYVKKRREAQDQGMKRGGMVSKVSSASSRADGIATKGKTRGKIC